VQLACRERRQPQSNPSAPRPQVSSVPDPASAGWSANKKMRAEKCSELKLKSDFLATFGQPELS
jgi:hypothetical protein